MATLEKLEETAQLVCKLSASGTTFPEPLTYEHLEELRTAFGLRW